MERACAELIRGAHDRYRFVVVTADIGDDLQALVDRWVRIRVPPRPIPLKFVAFFVAAGLAVRRLEVDLIHTVGAIIPNRVDLAAVHFCHAGYVDRTGQLSPAAGATFRRLNTGLSRLLALAAEHWCYRPSRVGSFAAVSPGVGEELARHYPGIPLTNAPNGVDLRRFRPDEQAGQALRDSESVGEEVVALFVGGDWAHKGLDVAVRALQRAHEKGAHLLLWVVGRGDEAAYTSLASRLGVEDAVEFFGWQTDVERFYQAADLFVLPTEYETYSLVSYEAAACGLPVVAPPVSGIEDLLEEDGAGIAVERTVESVAGTLARLATDPALRARLGKQARRRVEGRSWKASVRRVTDLYRQLLTQRDGSGAG